MHTLLIKSSLTRHSEMCRVVAMILTLWEAFGWIAYDTDFDGSFESLRSTVRYSPAPFPHILD